jgi:hypothetical protein
LIISEQDEAYVKEAEIIAKKYVVDVVWEFDVLRLPNGQYAAFWQEGYKLGLGVEIALGDYEKANFAHLGTLYSTAVFVKNELEEAKSRDPINMKRFSINLNGVVANALRDTNRM